MRDVLSQVSKKKQKQIDEFRELEYTVDSFITVPDKYLSKYCLRDRDVRCQIIKVNKKTLLVTSAEQSSTTPIKIEKEHVKSKFIGDVGANPFPTYRDRLRSVNYQLESIVFTLDIFNERNREYDVDGIPVRELNWNPYVINEDGKPETYQRDFVWSLTDKQSLIDSLYNGIECGKIVVRKRSWKELDILVKKYKITDIAFNDIIDGKQRLNTLREFVLGEFHDSMGNYYADLTAMAQNKLFSNQLIGFAEMDEDSSDDQVLEQFLKMNFSGIPQSKDHIEYVKSLRKLL